MALFQLAENIAKNLGYTRIMHNPDSRLIHRERGGSRIPHPLGWGGRAQFDFRQLLIVQFAVISISVMVPLYPSSRAFA
jgi:hypothetical protein